MVTWQVRTCDSCYNRVFDKQEKERRKAFLASIRPVDQTQRIASTHKERGANDLLQARKDLFGGSDSQQSASSTGLEKEKGGMANTMSTMNEAQEKLRERGEKLSKMSDRTAEMASQANE
jgi:hypothetical protein